MVPGLSAHESISKNKALLLSEHPFDFDVIVAIYHPEHTAPPKLEQLKQHKLAWDLAYDLHLLLGLPVKGYEVLDIKQGLELVKNRRVDIYLAEKVSCYNTCKVKRPSNYNLCSTENFCTTLSIWLLLITRRVDLLKNYGINVLFIYIKQVS